ncbi:MAG: HigA family addiction module antitoxin, partial [Chitinophagaceae bacterium]
EFAGRLGMRQSHLNEILQGKRKINVQTALKLEKEFGASAEFWMGLQTRYDLEIERQKNHEEYV